MPAKHSKSLRLIDGLSVGVGCLTDQVQFDRLGPDSITYRLKGSRLFDFRLNETGQVAKHCFGHLSVANARARACSLTLILAASAVNRGSP